MKLYLYGYSNRITSSRRLEAESHRNIELRWLLNNLTPDFKTIADYRKDNLSAIREMTISFRVMLKGWKLIDGALMALDGTKLKGKAGSGLLSYEELFKQAGEIDTEIEKYMLLLQSNDIREDMQEKDDSALKTVEAITQRIEELEKQRKQLEGFKKLSEQDNQRKINPIDPDSRMIKGKKESFSGYNLQVIVDSLHKLIASARMRQTTNDMEEMIPALENIKEELDIKPDVLLADQGYNNVLQLQKIEQDQLTDAHVMVGECAKDVEDYNKPGFQYDKDNDCYICPRGHILKKRGGIQKRRNRFAVIYQCKVRVCRECNIRSSCTSSKTGRTITRYTDEEWVEAYRNRMHSEKSKSLLKQRKSIIEHVFGVLKCWMGKIPLLLRGKEKVQAEINLYTTAYNLKRLIKICGYDKLMDMITELKLHLRANEAVFSYKSSAFIVYWVAN